MLEKHLWNNFLIYVMVEIRQPVNEISSFPEVHYKRCGNLKNFSKLTDKHKNQSSRRVLYQEMLFKIPQNSQIKIFSRVSFLIKLQAGNLKLSEPSTAIDVL